MDSGTTVICEKRTYYNESKSHQHDFGQFLFPLHGSLNIQTKWQKINLKSENILYIPPECNHVYHSTNRNEFLILDIPNYYLPNETESMYMKLDKKWSAIRYLLLEEARNQGKSSASLYDLTRFVVHNLQKSISPSIDFIHKYYRRPIRIKDLAKIEHYHPVYYSNWFKQKTGKSPQAYISDLRLGDAKKLLSTTSQSISDISEELGYENSSSFTRWFVGCTGISPQKYRNVNLR